jgi:hypothetical protein
MNEHLQELETMKANWEKGILTAASAHLADGSLERWGGLTLIVNITPGSAQMISTECRHRLATSLFRHAEEMAKLGEDIGSMAT